MTANSMHQRNYNFICGTVHLIRGKENVTIFATSESKLLVFPCGHGVKKMNMHQFFCFFLLQKKPKKLTPWVRGVPQIVFHPKFYFICDLKSHSIPLRPQSENNDNCHQHASIFCQSQARLKPKRSLDGFIFTL
jgi:hypothetical protein